MTPAVLIPRPETEHLVEAVLELHKAEPRTPRPRILDVGAGSGCIAVTLALEIRGAEVFGSDISEGALQIARDNASALQASVAFLCMDVLDGVTGEFDFIVSNPPYVRRGDISRLQREVREYEPHVALFSPEDELQVYRRLIAGAEGLLRPSGHLLMEVGIGMDERVLGLFGEKWQKLPTKTDLQGIPRTGNKVSSPNCRYDECIIVSPRMVQHDAKRREVQDARGTGRPARYQQFSSTHPQKFLDATGFTQDSSLRTQDSADEDV